jgi:hypothetical protein
MLDTACLTAGCFFMFGFISQLSLQTEARESLEIFARACPPPAKVVKHKPVPESKVAASLETLHKRIALYAQNQSLSFIGRARLAKALQNEMNRLGYPADLVSRVVSAVTVNALVAPSRRG